jgi:hypothetical protein
MPFDRAARPPSNAAIATLLRVTFGSRFSSQKDKIAPLAKMRKQLLLATVAVVAVSTPASAEVKRDILGFHPGMLYREAMSRLEKICKNEIQSGKGRTELYANCSLSSSEPWPPFETPEEMDRASKITSKWEILHLGFASNLSEHSLISVQYQFHTSSLNSDLVRSIFDQFGVPCDLRGKFCYPAQEDGCGGVKMKLPLDPPQQNLSEKSVPHDLGDMLLDDSVPFAGLWLTLYKGSSGCQGVADGSFGVLSLADTRIKEADKDGYRAKNPPPKF